MTDSSDKLRIVFAGTPEFAALHLQALLKNDQHEVVAVYTQPDRPSGRGKKLTASPVKKMAAKHNLPVLQPSGLKRRQDQRQLAKFQADIMVVVAYGLLLPQTILETPRIGCINVHASLLPRWRGAAPIQRAIEAGDTETGVTIMQMDQGLDTGDMIVSAHLPISMDETSGTLHDKLADIGPPALITALNNLANGTALAEKQASSQSNYAPKISKQEALIDWHQDATVIDRKVRAFNPFPITYTELDGERVRVWEGKPLPSTQQENNPDIQPGTIIAASNEGLEVACGSGHFLITKLQLPGKTRLAVSEILKSRADFFSVGKQFSLVLRLEG